MLEIGGLENTILEQRRTKMLRDQQRRDREKGYQVSHTYLGMHAATSIHTSMHTQTPESQCSNEHGHMTTDDRTITTTSFTHTSL